MGVVDPFQVSLLRGVLRSCLMGGEAELKEVSPGDSGSFGSGVYNSGFKQLLGEVTVDDGMYES